MDEYIPLPYPKMLYHESGDRTVVATLAEYEALGAGWAESPSGPWTKRVPVPEADRLTPAVQGPTPRPRGRPKRKR